MQALSKLVFGIDEEKTVQKKEIVDGIKRTSWLTNLETGRAMDTVSRGWGKFPGIVPVLWKARRKFRRVTETARIVASVPSVPKSRKNR
jgi:hypothetical protein